MELFVQPRSEFIQDRHRCANDVFGDLFVEHGKRLINDIAFHRKFYSHPCHRCNPRLCFYGYIHFFVPDGVLVAGWLAAFNLPSTSDNQ